MNFCTAQRSTSRSGAHLKQKYCILILIRNTRTTLKAAKNIGTVALEKNVHIYCKSELNI